MAREICHASKQEQVLSIETASTLMAPHIQPDATLVPVPSRHGYATQTLELAQHISNLLGCPIADVVKGKARKSLYEIKKYGGTFKCEDFDFSIIGDCGKSPLIIDFVFATGLTVASIAKLIPNVSAFVLARDSTSRLVDFQSFQFVQATSS